MKNIIYLLERDLAWSALRDWLASPLFKEKAPLQLVISETAIGKEVRERQSEHWQWWRGDARGSVLRELLQRIPEIWEQEGWATTETIVKGRPRRIEYSPVVLNKARSIYGDGHQRETRESTYRWAESVLGEKTRQRTVYIVVVSASVYREFAEAVGDTGIEGKTREELAAEFDLAKPVANDFVKWLLSTGQWRIVRFRRNGGQQRQLKRIINEEA